MVSESKLLVNVRIVAVDPPFDAGHGVLFGLQAKDGDVDAVPAAKTTTFETELELVRTGDLVGDFRGPHVHGRKGDRFIYLSWGVGDEAEPFVMFARAKLMLVDIPGEVLAGTIDGDVDLEGRLAATNAKAQPASGTIRPPSVTWHAVAAGVASGDAGAST